MYGPLVIQDYDGADVLDATNTKIGSVERSYDDENGVVQYVEVKMGNLLHRQHRLVPADGVEMTDEGLRVPYTRETIENGPDASDWGDDLDGDALAAVQAYWNGIESGAGPVAADPVDPSAADADSDSESSDSDVVLVASGSNADPDS